jgi:hypothetical protein
MPEWGLISNLIDGPLANTLSVVIRRDVRNVFILRVLPTVVT